MRLEQFFSDNKIDLKNKCLVVASSGGPDSMALTEMLVRLQQKFDFRLVVAHFDHQLRGDSFKETELLTKYCAKRKLCLKNGRWEKSLQPKNGIEAAARQYRYHFLTSVMQEVGGDYLLTAHHGDDLLENILLKFIRSGNPQEMNSLQAIGTMHGYTLLRPLLAYSKEELLSYDQRNQLQFIQDTTNDEDETLRNRLRHHVVPLLKKENANLIKNANEFSKDTGILTNLAKQRVRMIKQPEIFLNYFYREKLEDLAQVTEKEREYFWQDFIWRHWHRRVGEELHGFKQMTYQGYQYLWPQKIELDSNIFSIDTEKVFSFRGQRFILSIEPKNDLQLIGDFWSNENKFKVGSLPKGSKLLLKNGQHAKAKKMFAQAAIPQLLRPFCLTVFKQDGQAVFVEETYQDQTWLNSAKHYYLYLLKKV